MINYKRIASSIVATRKTKLDQFEIAVSQAILDNPKLLEIEKQLRQIVIADAKGQKIDKKQQTDLLKQKDVLLANLGLSANPPKPNCAKCKDSGYIGTDFCACVKSTIINRPENIEFKINSFSDIDYSRFDPKFCDINKRVYLAIEKWASEYPNVKKPIALISGGTGVGKTLLAGCVVSSFLSKGFSAVAVTAFGFVNRALKYHTTFDDSKLEFLEPLLESDVLVIDDLGTESVLKNVTQEYLLAVLNERTNQNKVTIFTTNLSKDGILERYGKRNYSRLFDKDTTKQAKLSSDDLRVKN